jgi:beta-hydroxylase
MAGTQALRGAEGKSPWKAWRRGRVKMLGLGTLKLLARLYARQTKVPDVAIIPNEHFPFIADLERDWQAVRAELEGILKDREAIPHLDKISPDQARIAHSQKWRAYFLFGMGEELTGNTARCPRTAELLRRVPGLRSAWFSILGPRYKLKRHRGISKGVLRAHLGLIVPRKWQNCRMNVDGETVRWREGSCFVFDDARLHYVVNGTDEERVILLFDFDRPMRWPSSMFNNLAMALLKRTAFYRDARKNLKRHKRAALTEQARDTAIADAMQRVAD